MGIYVCVYMCKCVKACGGGNAIAGEHIITQPCATDAGSTQHSSTSVGIKRSSPSPASLYLLRATE